MSRRPLEGLAIPLGAYRRIRAPPGGRSEGGVPGRGQGDQRAEAPPPVDNSGSNQPAHRGRRVVPETVLSNGDLQWGNRLVACFATP